MIQTGQREMGAGSDRVGERAKDGPRSVGQGPIRMVDNTNRTSFDQNQRESDVEYSDIEHRRERQQQYYFEKDPKKLVNFGSN